WAFDTGRTKYGVYSSPAIGSDGTIYVGSLEVPDNLYAINPDGSKKWAFATDYGVFSSPAIGSDGTIYVGSAGSCCSGRRYSLFALKTSDKGPADSTWPMFGGSSRRIGIKSAPPIITQQPLDQTIDFGVSTNFKLSVYGIGPFDYQWYKNGKQIKGATDTVLKLDNATKEDEAIYSVKITNDFGIARSRIAQLTLRTDPPSITMQPKDAEVDLGEYTEFLVAVKGAEPFDYQWYKNGIIIEDGNKATLVIPSASESDITIYSVRIKNQFGKAISRIAELKLKKPKITLRPPTIDASGRLVLIANGPPNRKVIFQFSNDLVKWIDQLTLPLSDGATTFNVPIQSSSNAPNLFYRLKLVE
ncbi:immunoglobulin domain-containing protein, partial [bacterium]|nr:immunoglobulin domain-containing protein [bacterium]